MGLTSWTQLIESTQEHILLAGGFTMDEQLRSVSPLNPFNPRMSGWRESFFVRQQGSFGSAGIKCATAGMLGDKLSYTSAKG